MSDNRTETRERLAKLIRDNANPQKIQDAFASPRTSDIAERAKIVYVGTMGETRPRVAEDFVFGGFNLSLNLITRYPAQGTGWAQAEADGILDSMRGEINTIVDENFILDGYWQELTFEGASKVQDMELSDRQIKYRIEIIPVRVIS